MVPELQTLSSIRFPLEVKTLLLDSEEEQTGTLIGSFKDNIRMLYPYKLKDFNIEDEGEPEETNLFEDMMYTLDTLGVDELPILMSSEDGEQWHRTEVNYSTLEIPSEKTKPLVITFNFRIRDKVDNLSRILGVLAEKDAVIRLDMTRIRCLTGYGTDEDWELNPDLKAKWDL